MFNFEYNGKTYRVKFQHVQRELWKKVQALKPKKDRLPLPKEAKGNKAVTICTISEVTPEGQVRVLKTTATCFDSDLFVKKRGRTISLGRAIKAFGYEGIWDAYEDAMDKAYLTSMKNLQKPN